MRDGEEQEPVTTAVKNGEIRRMAGGVEGRAQIFFDGYWIRYYDPPEESLVQKKLLLDAVTRRTFHHTESGINTPGDRLEAVRAAYCQQTHPQHKRVNAAMLAGALFNRATDIFTTIVELEQKGIHITPNDDLMQQCSRCLSEALSLCGNVKHHSGEEGIDELWGEPVKVFTMSIADYYQSRYRKIAQAMRAIDQIGAAIQQTFCHLPWFQAAAPLVADFIAVAKHESEILRRDADYLIIWPKFVADGEKLLQFRAQMPAQANNGLERHIKRGTNLIHAGQSLLTWIANARVPMPISTDRYMQQCADYQDRTGGLCG